MQDASVDVWMLARHVLEHGLIPVDLSTFQHNGEAEQRKEHEWDEECRHSHGDKVQREIQHGRIRRSHDEVAIAGIGILACEQTLP